MVWILSLETQMQNVEIQIFHDKKQCMCMTLSTLALLVPKSQVSVVLYQQIQQGFVSLFSGHHRWSATHLVLDIDLCPLGQEEADHLC